MSQLQLKVSGMHCTSCAMNIEGELEDLPGVKRVNVHFAKQMADVEYDETQVDSHKIITTIETLGYQVSQA